MTPARYKEVGELYRAALEVDADQRAAFLIEASSGDEALRQEVESLLGYAAQPGGLIDQPALEVAAQTLREEPTTIQFKQNISHYRLLSLLGKGGMGEVYLGEDTQLKRKVAVKLLPAAFTHDAERVQRFAREAHAVSALNHPNILTIHEIGASEGMHYIVTEYVEGETLRQRLTAASQQPMPLTDTLTVAAQMAEALAAAHEAGIIHRDIKPENVMVRRDGYVKVLDFGLAKLTENQNGEEDKTLIAVASTATGVVMGTPRYMSPEQARGEKVDARTDLFSLGVVLYEMIAGHAPFMGATASETLAAILRDEPLTLTAAAPDTPPELQHIIHRALQKKRDERYQTATELLADLKRFQRHLDRTQGTQDDLASPATYERDGTALTLPLPLSTDPLIPAQTPQKFWRSGKWPVLIAAAVILIVAATWFYFQRASPPPGKDTVLLADFTNQTSDDVFDKTLKQGLATQLGQSRFLNVFPEVRVQQTLRQMERPADTRVTAQLAQEICERQNLKAFIVGAIAPLGNHYVITLTALRGSNGEELTRTQATANSKEQVLHALDEAAAQLRAQLGESLSSIQQSDQPLAQATTSDLRALKAYSEATALMTSGRFVEALPFAQRAAELDPQFAGAYDQLTILCLATEQPEAAAAYATKTSQLLQEKAAQSKDSVSELTKLDSTSWYHRVVTGNQNKQLESLLPRRQLAPRSAPAQSDLGSSYNSVGQSEQALAPLHEAIRLNRNFAAPYRVLGQVLIRLNRFAEAQDTLAQALQLKLEITDYHTQLYQLAFISGDAAGMQQQLDWSRGQPDEYVALDWQTGAAAFAGQWRQAQDFSRRSIELAARRDNREVAAKYATEQALRSAVLGNCQMTKVSAANGLTFGRGRLPLSRAGLALALCGAAPQAQTLADELTKRFPEDTLSQEVWLPLIRAALKLQRGEAAQAIEQLRNTSRYEAAAEFWPQYLRGQAYLQLKQNAEAATEFQKILDNRGYAPLSPLSPLAQLGLARAVQRRNAFDAFFALWKDADAGLSVLIAAKKEYEKVN